MSTLDEPDSLPEAMMDAYARYLRETMAADPRVLGARTGAELQAAATACLLESENPLDIKVERDPDDPRRVNITIAPKPWLTVTALVHR